MPKKKKETKQLYSYISNGTKKEVYCTYIDYLFLKLHYDDNGLSEEEYKYFKENINKN